MKTKLNSDYYVRRIMKSETPFDFMKNQMDLLLFLNRRFGYEQEKALTNYKEMIQKLEPEKSSA